MTTKTSTTRKRSRTKVTAKVEGNGANTLPSQIRNLAISEIKPDASQPRKTFDDKNLKLLSESIKVHGVLQPITVRKLEKDFIIVMGERRYRASKLAGKKTIPCIIKDYQNKDVLEIQIIENLQRQDVEPTEEAEAITYLREKYSPSEIANRLGRTDNFVRQRLKLAGLIEGFKHFVRSGEMTISLGVGVALFEPEEQQMMLETIGENFNTHQINRMIKDKTYDLEKASFDINDNKLILKAGSCVKCLFNATNQGNLFGDGKMVCTKSACFEAKKNKSLLNLISKSKEKNILLIPEIRKYWADDENNQFVISQLEKHRLKVYLLDDVEIIEEPIKPTFKSINEEFRHYDYSKDELKKELDEAKQIYSEKLKTYNLARDNGFENGIVFHPKSYIQRKVLIKINDIYDNNSQVHSMLLANRKMTDCTPEEQIVKINEREIRKKQIENNKQFEDVVEMIRETKYIDIKKALSVDEMVAFSISLFENNVDYVSQQKYFSELLGDTSKMNKVDVVRSFKTGFKKEVFYRLIRYMITNQVHFGENNHTNNFTNISFYNAMQGYYKSRIVGIEKDYDEKRKKREERLKDRIAILEKKVHELSK